MDAQLRQLCETMSKKDRESFDILEQNILEQGLDSFIENNHELYRKHFDIISSRNYYNERAIDTYLKSLDLARELRIGFLDHMNNQNIAKVCYEDIQRNQVEIDRLKNLIAEQGCS